MSVLHFKGRSDLNFAPTFAWKFESSRVADHEIREAAKVLFLNSTRKGWGVAYHRASARLSPGSWTALLAPLPRTRTTRIG